MLEEKLRKLSFSEKEIKVYLCVFRQGKITHSKVAKITGINRSTVYSVAQELVDQGVIAEDLSGKTSFLVALPPKSLMNMLKKEKRMIQKKEDLIQESIQEISLLESGKKYSVPKIKFLEDEEMEDYLYSQMKLWSKDAKKTDGICWGFQDFSFPEKFEKWIEWADKNFGLEIKLFSNNSEVENRMKEKNMPRRKILFWKGNNNFTSSIWIMGNYLVMLVTQDKPYYLVEINDSVMAHNFREFFRAIWKDNPKN